MSQSKPAGVPDQPTAAPPTVEDMDRVLLTVPFSDRQASCQRLHRLAAEPVSGTVVLALLPYLAASLADCADPDRVVVGLERLAHGKVDPSNLFQSLADNPRTVEIMVSLFAGSQFLTEIVLGSPEYLFRLTDQKRLARRQSVEQYSMEPSAIASSRESYTKRLNALRRFQRWELLRIGACDLLNLFDLPTVTGQLSNLADSLIRACLTLASEQFATPIGDFAVVALGKLGGKELNYSSDIDLLFIAASNAPAYTQLGARLIEALTLATTEGFLYRVDMRLRPWGRVGALVSSLKGYMAYLDKSARLWERQALLKARVAAGNPQTGFHFLDGVRLLLPESAEVIRATVHQMKERTETQLRQQGREWGQVKLGKGSIRDIEFVTQYLQMVHGTDRPDLLSSNTLQTLVQLAAHGLLANGEYRILSDGYVFLRTIEHYLQMMDYRQTHTLPQDSEALARLARRLGYLGPQAGDQFLARYQQHSEAVRAVYLTYMGSEEMKGTPDLEPMQPLATVQDHLSRMAPSYAAAFGQDEIEHHTLLAGMLDNDSLVQVAAAPLPQGQWKVTIVAYDYPGELSLICGLLFAHGFSIHAGGVFTYQDELLPDGQGDGQATPRKIVDVFTVVSLQGDVDAAAWSRYSEDLASLLRLMQADERRQARGQLAKRVALALQESAASPTKLYPIDIEIDNELSDRYTVLQITTSDTPGFLYEFANALAYSRIYISHVLVDSIGSRVHDTLYVTDSRGSKITSAKDLRELQATILLTKHFTHLLPHSPNPESALLHFREFLGQIFQRPDWPQELASLERPEVLDALARLLGISDFLWDDFLRMQHANLFPVVRDLDALETAKTREQLQAELEEELSPVHSGPQPPAEDLPWRSTLTAFRDREMFRVDMRHILGHTLEFHDFSNELTDLVEVTVNSTYHLCHEDLRYVYGSPRLESGDVSDMVVCALGKCGGRELGFASDIELMFVYSGNGVTSGPASLTTAEFYERVVQTFVQASQARREGIFQIDLQLRPYGKAGSLAVSLEAFRRYFAPAGPAWAYERQALVKLRPIAGNTGLGSEVIRLVNEAVYSSGPYDVTAMRAMRQRQLRHLVRGGSFNAKYSPGGLIDVEYLVQALQITHGRRDISLRLTNTRQAMAALAASGHLNPEDYKDLRRAHTFLRWLIDALRVVRGNTKDLTVPEPDSEEFAFLARRLRYGNDVVQLRDELARHSLAVEELNTRLLP